MAKTAKKFTVDDAAAEVVAAFEKFLQTLAGSNGVSTATEVDEDEVVEDDEEDGEVEALDRETVEGLKIGELRALAKEYLGDDAPTKKADILEALEEFFEDAESDEDEDEDEEDAEEVEDDEEADEDEEDEYTREFLEELDLKELRKIAKDEGHSASDYRGMDQDALVDLILGESDEDDDEDESDEDDEDVEELDEDALKAMTEKELTALAKELGIKVPAKVKSLKGAKLKKALVDLILDSGEEE